MNKQFQRSFPVLFIFLALIRFLPFIFPEGRFWGFNHLIFLNSIYIIVFAGLLITAGVIPFINRSKNLGDSLTNSFSALYYEHPRRHLFALMTITFFGILFVVLRAPTHFLGDGYTALGNLASQAGTIFKWSEAGATTLLNTIQSFLGPKNIGTAEYAFQIVSIISGMITVWFFIRIAGELSGDPVKRFLSFACMISSAMLLLFFGYVESYPPAWAAFSGFVCFSLRYITIGRGLIFSSIFLIIGIVFHLQLALYIPAFIFLLISRGPGQKFYEKYRHPIRIMIGFSIGLAFYIFVRKYQSDLYFENIFLPLFNGKPLAPYYALLSLPHLADIANQLLLLSPLLPLIAVLSLRRFWNISLGKKEMFLSITAVFGLIFLFIIDPKLGMPRDWDLFSFSALAPTLLLISLIPERMTINLQRFIPSIGIFLIAALLPYLAINLDRDSSVNYFKYMINLDMPKSQSSWNTLRDYCNLNGDPRSADSLDYYFCINFPNENKMDLAFSALDNNNLELAETLLSLIKPDRLSSNYHNLKSEIYYHQGNTGPALVELKKAIQLRQYDALLYYNLSIIYAASKQYEEAYVALKKGYGFDSTHNEILTGLAGYHLILGDPDSMEIYARKLIGLDSTNHYAYQLLSEMYDLRNNRKLAAKYYDLHLKYRATDTTSDSVPSEFQQRMEMIKSNKH